MKKTIFSCDVCRREIGPTFLKDLSVKTGAQFEDSYEYAEVCPACRIAVLKAVGAEINNLKESAEETTD